MTSLVEPTLGHCVRHTPPLTPKAPEASCLIPDLLEIFNLKIGAVVGTWAAYRCRLLSAAAALEGQGPLVGARGHRAWIVTHQTAEAEDPGLPRPDE